MKKIKCDHGDYTAILDTPFGPNSKLAPKMIDWHEGAFPGHKCSIVEEEK